MSSRAVSIQIPASTMPRPISDMAMAAAAGDTHVSGNARTPVSGGYRKSSA